MAETSVIAPKRSPRTAVLLLVLAVTAILAGLLAMHTVALSESAAGHSMASMQAVPDHAHPGTSAGSGVGAPLVTVTSTATGADAPISMIGDEPLGDCGAGCTAMQMVCALVILIITFLCLRRPLSGGGILASLVAPTRFFTPAGGPPGRAPSLDVLCISRT